MPLFLRVGLYVVQYSLLVLLDLFASYSDISIDERKRGRAIASSQESSC